MYATAMSKSMLELFVIKCCEKKRELDKMAEASARNSARPAS